MKTTTKRPQARQINGTNHIILPEGLTGQDLKRIVKKRQHPDQTRIKF